MEILNRKARFNYDVIDTYECGIELKGSEIKSIRKGSVDLSDSYAVVKNREIFLLNTYIAEYDNASYYNHDTRRSRKLLLHKSEINKIEREIKVKHLTLIPLKIYFKHNKAKVELGICKGKKLYDKRETIKKRDLERYGE